MRRARTIHRAIAFVAALLIAATVALGADPAGTTASDAFRGDALLTALRTGGYVIYFRHTATDFSQNDARMTGYEDCATQRNLTDAGRADARAIGASMRALGIPVGEVLASPYCRTMEMAQLTFGRATASAAVRGGPAQASAERYADLVRLLSTPVGPGSNLVIASHGNPFRAVAGGAYLAEGEAAIVEPQSEAGFRVVARVRKDEWDTLATAAK